MQVMGVMQSRISKAEVISSVTRFREVWMGRLVAGLLAVVGP